MKPFFLTDNRFEDATPTASATASGYDVANISDRRPYTLWVGTGTGTFYLYIDSGSAKPADTLAVSGHNFSASGSSVSLQSSSTGAWAGEEVTRIAAFTTAVTTPLVKTFREVSARYWRLKIVASASAPQVGVVLLGQRMEMTGSPQGGFTPHSFRPQTVSTVSKAGHPLGTVRKYNEVIARGQIKFQSLSFVDETFRPFWLANFGMPVAFSWDLDTWPNDAVYGRLTGDLSPPLDLMDRYSLSFTVEGVL